MVPFVLVVLLVGVETSATEGVVVVSDTVVGEEAVEAGGNVTVVEAGEEVIVEAG